MNCEFQEEEYMGSTRDNIYIDINKRTFFLADNIDNESAGKIMWDILYLIREDDEQDKKILCYNREPIKLYINSYGGMWGLIDIILASKTPIYTYCLGYAQSAAFNIFLAGHKRFCLEHSVFMYHQMSYWRDGKHQDFVENRVEMDNINKQNEEYVIKRTKIPEDVIRNVRETKKDFYIHSSKAIEYGIVDEILM